MSKIQEAARRLGQAIAIKTSSPQSMESVDREAFSTFIAFLETGYPLVHQQLIRSLVNGFGLVYRWPGRDSQAAILLTAHYDVVPAEDGGWAHPPFDGLVQDGRIHGRGALDDKGSLIAILEAVSDLLAEGFVPPMDVYLAFGFDEEVGGALGAQQIAQHFQKNKLHFDLVLDEGGAVADGQMMGIDKPIAVIGVAEKGNTSFRLSFTGEEGHSSAPPRHTAVSRMAQLVEKVSRKPQRARLTPTLIAMLKAIAPYKKGIQGLVMAHPKLFAPLLLASMDKNRQTAAMLRTTQAFTQASGGSAHNVLPQQASCTVNLRILQGDSVDKALMRLKSHGIPFEAQALQLAEPTTASPSEGPGFDHLQRTIHKVFPDALCTPYLMTGGTDCRHYQALCKASYRFLPARLSQKELASIHGRDESLSLENLQSMVDFYTHFLRDLPQRL